MTWCRSQTLHTTNVNRIKFIHFIPFLTLKAILKFLSDKKLVDKRPFIACVPRIQLFVSCSHSLPLSPALCLKELYDCELHCCFNIGETTRILWLCAEWMISTPVEFIFDGIHIVATTKNESCALSNIRNELVAFYYLLKCCTNVLNEQKSEAFFEVFFLLCFALLCFVLFCSRVCTYMCGV